MELKEAIEKCEKAVKVLTGNDTGIRLDFEGTASAIDTVLEELNNRIPREIVENKLKELEEEDYILSSRESEISILKDLLNKGQIL